MGAEPGSPGRGGRWPASLEATRRACLGACECGHRPWIVTRCGVRCEQVLRNGKEVRDLAQLQKAPSEALVVWPTSPWVSWGYPASAHPLVQPGGAQPQSSCCPHRTPSFWDSGSSSGAVPSPPSHQRLQPLRIFWAFPLPWALTAGFWRCTCCSHRDGSCRGCPPLGGVMASMAPATLGLSRHGQTWSPEALILPRPPAGSLMERRAVPHSVVPGLTGVPSRCQVRP